MTVNAWKEYRIHLAITYKPSINGCEKVSDPYHTTYLLQEILFQRLLTVSSYKKGRYLYYSMTASAWEERIYPQVVAHLWREM